MCGDNNYISIYI